MHRALFVYLLTLVACASDASSSQGFLWTIPQKEAAVSACVNAIPQPISVAIKRYACLCVIEAAGNRWTYDEFASNEYACTRQLETDGTVRRCALEASHVD
jgi:hypothetical protein